MLRFIWFLLQKLLENDFQITLSKNIADAKKIIEDEDYQFDVMLIDLIMPRDNGFD